jgi:hypothetical protein
LPFSPATDRYSATADGRQLESLVRMAFLTMKSMNIHEDLQEEAFQTVFKSHFIILHAPSCSS